MLKSLAIEGYRAFGKPRSLKPAQPKGVPGSGMTILVGPNNSGKSTIIDAISSRKPHQPTSFNSGVRNRKKDFVKLTFQFSTHEETIKSIGKGSSEAEQIGVNYAEGKIYVVPSRRYFSPAFGKTTPSDRTQFRINYGQNTEVRSSPEMASFPGRLFQIERDQENFNTLLRKILPGLLHWSIDQHEVGGHFLKFSSDVRAHSSAGVGEGVISAFVITSALYDSEAGETIVIDEPELSLHPQIQRRLMAVLEEFSKDRQIIISTHSPYFVTKSALLGGARVYRTWDRGNIEMFYVDIDGDFGLKQILTDDLNKPHVFGLDAREIFFLDDGVIVTEGQEDVVFWPIAVGQEFAAKHSIFGWGAGGATNIKSILKLLQSLGFQRVVAVFDHDVPAEAALVEAEFPTFKVLSIPADDIRTKKAVKARAAKAGLLDAGNKKVRPEYAEAMKALITSADEYLSQGE